MKTITQQRTPFIDELVKGFTIERLRNNVWESVILIDNLTPEQKELYQLLIDNNQVKVSYEVFEDEEDITQESNWITNIIYKIWKSIIPTLQLPSFKQLYTAFFSFAFLALFALSCILLSMIDVSWGSTAEGMVMPSGIKLLQLVLYVLGIHSGAISICKIIDYTSSGFKTYIYENPYLKVTEFDKYSDVNNLDDKKAKERLLWHDKRFYTFYFISVFLLTVILFLKMYLQVN